MSTPSTEEFLRRMQAAREAILSACSALVKAAEALGEAPKEATCNHAWIREWPVGSLYCSHCGAQRFPCSDTCTHPDAATPGHPERVKERSEAFSVAQNAPCDACPGEARACVTCPDRVMPGEDDDLCVQSGEEQTSEGYDEGHADGAEAMRAACWEEVAVTLSAEGFTSNERLWERLKAAIEGATP